MTYEYTLNGDALEFGPFETGEGDDRVKHSEAILLCWSDEELAAIGVVRTLAPEPPPPRRLIPKSTVMARVFALGKQAEVKALFDASFELHSKWFSPDWPNVYADDEGLLAALDGMGLTAEEVVAVTAPPGDA